MRAAKRTNTKKDKTIKLKKVLTVANIQNQSVTRLDWSGEFLNAFGRPQDRGLWFVWGDSGSGKSSFVMQLAKAMSCMFPTLYNLLEEEPDDSDYIDRTKLFNMQDVKDNFHTANYTTLEELDAYCEKRNSKKVIIIDSIVYLTKDWEAWFAFKKKWEKKKILIVVGHAKGKNPKTEFEDKIMFDAKMKIFITGYLAICKGRTIGKNGGKYIVYQEGYEKLRGAESA